MLLEVFCIAAVFTKGLQFHCRFPTCYWHPVIVVSAGGGLTCEKAFELTVPVFNSFNANVTAARDDCLKRIGDFGLAYKSSLSDSDLQAGLYDINVGCNGQFNGYLMQFVSILEILLSVNSQDILNIVYGGPRGPAEFPLNCIENELTSASPNIMIANGDIAGEIDTILHSN